MRERAYGHKKVRGPVCVRRRGPVCRRRMWLWGSKPEFDFLPLKDHHRK